MPSYETARANNLQGVKELKNWYSNQNRFVPIEKVKSGEFVPQKGDIFFKKSVDSETGRDAWHAGFVTSYDNVTQRFNTIEGNTNDKKSSDGYGVYELNRTLKDIVGFGYNLYTGD